MDNDKVKAHVALVVSTADKYGEALGQILASPQEFYKVPRVFLEGLRSILTVNGELTKHLFVTQEMINDHIEEVVKKIKGEIK